MIRLCLGAIREGQAKLIANAPRRLCKNAKVFGENLPPKRFGRRTFPSMLTIYQVGHRETEAGRLCCVTIGVLLPVFSKIPFDEIVHGERPRTAREQENKNRSPEDMIGPGGRVDDLNNKDHGE